MALFAIVCIHIIALAWIFGNRQGHGLMYASAASASCGSFLAVLRSYRSWKHTKALQADFEKLIETEEGRRSLSRPMSAREMEELLRSVDEQPVLSAPSIVERILGKLSGVLGGQTEHVGNFMGFLLPKSTREKAFIPTLEDVKMDRIEARRNYLKSWQHGILEIFFLARVLIVYIQALWVAILSPLAKLGPFFRSFFTGG